MIVLLVLGILSAAGIVGTIIALGSDGYGHVLTDWSRLPDRPAREVTRAPARAAAPSVTRAAPRQAADGVPAAPDSPSTPGANTASTPLHETRLCPDALPAAPPAS